MKALLLDLTELGRPASMREAAHSLRVPKVLTSAWRTAVADAGQRRAEEKRHTSNTRTRRAAGLPILLPAILCVIYFPLPQSLRITRPCALEECKGGTEPKTADHRADILKITDKL